MFNARAHATCCISMNSDWNFLSIDVKSSINVKIIIQEIIFFELFIYTNIKVSQTVINFLWTITIFYITLHYFRSRHSSNFALGGLVHYSH